MNSTAQILWPPARRRLLLLLLGIVAYGPVIRTPFLWDDHTMIEGNPRLASWTAANLRHDFSTDVFDGHGDAYYRPLQTIANRIDYTVWGLRPVGFHLTNLAVHLTTALLLESFLLLLGFGLLEAFICASLFIVHPVPVEELMIIAGRAELFGLACTFACLNALLKAFGARAARLEETPGERLGNREGERPDWKQLTLSYGWYLIALGFKESAAAIPLLAALALVWRRERFRSFACIAGYILLLVPYFVLRHHAVGPALPGIGLSTYVQFFSRVFPYICWKYACLIAWPWNLHSHHVIPHIQPLWILQAALAIGFAAALVLRRSRIGWFALAWFLVSLLPKAPIMIFGHFVLDHWAYPASVGILLPLSVWFAYCWRHPGVTGARAAISLYLVLLVVYSLLTRLNLELRGADEKMYRWALNFSTSNPIKHNLGLLMMNQGRFDEAIPLLAEVSRTYPDDAESAYALAKAYDQSGHHQAAILLLREILARHPDYTPALTSLRRLLAAKR